MRRPLRSRLRRIADVAVPLVIGLYLTALVVDNSTGHAAALTIFGMLAGAAQGTALWWRRSHPVPVMAIALAGGLVVHLLAPQGIFPFAGLVAIGSLAATRPPRVSVPALAGLLGLTALNFLTAATGDAQFAMAFPVVAWALGEAVRNRRAAVEEASRRAAGEEQARIARELHDVIAHSVSVIVVQAAAADDVFDERPDQARAALRSIESAGREALGELRRLLAAVRPDADGESPHPRPGLDRLGELVEPLRAAGLKVAVRREGIDSAGPLPAGVDLSAYRIAQEALTNTLRHAGAGHAQVTVRASSGVLELEVLDDGRGAASTGNSAGRGIAGMRERAAMLGGTLDAGTRPGGGFRVHARLPLREAR
ncbi:sensor histidine kinase [Streptosporangium roseum]|uniref:histidine kinase n=1 Tax=Streptosporangium roseum (strain ATCC 12428 / DSM 43021 / JCM 3005 / KCTC 9067 / NCIMB 10171 / NRRL 2505 / NI 9100) TaxID=479432 RepID=D2BC47_STRRD|nr:sensor histidine kinase [Streptosporangium roseum]ACZ88070.1 putative two-component system sensor kinase [Streptosporangium roseum DSM 43021]